MNRVCAAAQLLLLCPACFEEARAVEARQLVHDLRWRARPGRPSASPSARRRWRRCRQPRPPAAAAPAPTRAPCRTAPRRSRPPAAPLTQQVTTTSRPAADEPVADTAHCCTTARVSRNPKTHQPQLPLTKLVKAGPPVQTAASTARCVLTCVGAPAAEDGGTAKEALAASIMSERARGAHLLGDASPSSRDLDVAAGSRTPPPSEHHGLPLLAHLVESSPRLSGTAASRTCWHDTSNPMQSDTHCS